MTAADAAHCALETETLSEYPRMPESSRPIWAYLSLRRPGETYVCVAEARR